MRRCCIASRFGLEHYQRHDPGSHLPPSTRRPDTVVDAQCSERGHSQSTTPLSAEGRLFSAAAVKRRYGRGERHFESRVSGQVMNGVDGEKRRVCGGSVARSRDGTRYRIDSPRRKEGWGLAGDWERAPGDVQLRPGIPPSPAVAPYCSGL